MVEDGAFSHKIDGVGPVDNRPSTNQLHHLVQIFKDNFFIYNIYFFYKKKYFVM